MEALEETLRRLKRERDEADRRYNDALTALDRALPPPPDLPPSRGAYDDALLASLNEEWRTLTAGPSGEGWRGRAIGFIWRTVAPYFERQLTFNAHVVDHLNRNVNAARDAHRASEETVARLRDEFARLGEFHARALAYLQQITAYIDTRDRDAAGGALVLNASLSGMAENADKRWESLAIRERRADERAAALRSSHDELRAILAVSQQASLSVKREVEKLLAREGPHAAPATEPVAAVAPQSSGTFGTIDSYKYVGFEDQFRGPREEIRARLSTYVPLFAGASDVLDVGCGRGEFLELLAEAKISARGIDINHEMVEQCRARGLDVAETDAVTYLTSLPDASIGGLFAAQVVEHLQPGYLLRFLELAFHKIRPGGRVILETLNPACWVAFFDSFIRDITHVWPLHPETLKYLVLASGFTRAEIDYRSPVRPQDRLQKIAIAESAAPPLGDIAEAFNGNVDKLNARIFTHLDYAVIGAR
ncbi:MAG TPA: methionine biosynthesis protein MetW [Vicinamibacterales bacterium]|jgi:SAM-dependent methyltransferase